MATKASRPRSSLMMRDYEDGGGFEPASVAAPAPKPAPAPAGGKFEFVGSGEDIQLVWVPTPAPASVAASVPALAPAPASSKPFAIGDKKLPEVEERIIDMGEGTRSEYYVKGTDIFVEPSYSEDWANATGTGESRNAPLKLDSYVIYDKEKQGEHKYSASGEYLGFTYAPRKSGLGGFLKEVVTETAPIWTAALTAGGGAAFLGQTLAPTLSTAAQGMIGSALVQGVSAEATGGEFIKGAISGAAGAAVGAYALDVGKAIGIENTVAANAVGSAVIKAGAAAALGGNVSTALIEGAISGALSGMKQDVAVKAAADADIAGGMVPEFGNTKTYDAFMAEAIKTGGVEQAVTSMLANTLTPSQLDAEFIAADAARQATQGLSEAQIKDVLNQYVSTPAASLAASMAVNNVPVETATQQLSNLSNNVGLFNAGASDATMIATDALRLKNQVGFNAPAIEQNLTASGVDPLVAADVTQQIGTNPNLTETDLASNLSNFYGDKIYDTPVDTMITSPKVEEPVKTEEPAKTEPKVNKGDIMKQMLKLIMAGDAASAVTSDKPKLSTSGLYTPATGDDIYKDAPIKGFAMRKYQDESGATRYTPVIGEQKLLDVPTGFKPVGMAKGGLVSRRK